ncbi:FecR family protein [Cyclobacterium salsum]|uniref:FecR family protein n=1 Tax=Cyclobacterium salsum TaxID=2666329 RepID=UPI001390716A|nr:FecR domain-containing protein [Cyclobacterium salsum]
MSYKNFKVEDLVQDAWFRAWVNGNDPEANVFWEKWLIKNPGEQEKVEQARQIVKSLSHLEAPMPADRKIAVWKAISSKTTLPQPQKRVEDSTKKSNNETVNTWLRAGLKLTASLLLILAAVFVFTAIRDSVNQIKLAKNNQSNSFQKETGERERIRFKLPDGSLVYLNSESKLTYDRGNDGFAREVYLSGEAYFDVKKDEENPFKVFANGSEITALGTEFNVKIGKSDSITVVSLVEGKVEVLNLSSEKKEALYLNEGERASITPSEKTMTKSTFDIISVTFWKEGLLQFDNTSILTVKEVLEQWYGINIVFQNTHKVDLKVTGRFDNEYLGNVLQSLSYSARFDYKVEEKTVYIKFKP